LTDEALRSLGDAVRGWGLAGVSVLDISGNGGVSREACGDFMRSIAESEIGLPKLRFLGIQSIDVCGGPVSLTLASGKLPSLEHFWYDSWCMSPFEFRLYDSGVGDLGDAVRRGNFPPHLKKIGFRLKQVGTNVDSLFRAIAESETGLPSCVRALILSGGQFSDEALALLSANGGGASVRKLSHLWSLDLSYCSVDDGMLRRLGEVFSAYECKELSRICLQGNRISIEGLKAFFDALSPESVPKLHSLDLKKQKGVGGEKLGKEEQEIFESSAESLLCEAVNAGKLRRIISLWRWLAWFE